jgi:hypothetical protein
LNLGTGSGRNQTADAKASTSITAITSGSVACFAADRRQAFTFDFGHPDPAKIAILNPVRATWINDFEARELGKVFVRGSDPADSVFAHERAV